MSRLSWLAAAVALWSLGCGDDGGGTPTDGGGSDDARTREDSGVPGEDGSTTRSDGGGGDGDGEGCNVDDVVDLGSDASVDRTFDNTGEGDDSTPADCGGICDGGRDVVFRYTAPEDGMLTVSTINPGTQAELDTVLSIYDACDGGGSLISCDNNTAGVLSRSVVPVSGGDELFIVVDGCGPEDVGDIQLTLNLEAGGGSGPGSDSCSSPTELQFSDVGGGVPAARGSGDTSGASNEHDVEGPGCGDVLDSPDHYYSFELTEADLQAGRGNVTLEVVPQDSGFDPYVYIIDAATCGELNFETRCADNEGAGETESTTPGFTIPSTYVIGIEGADGTSGAYDLIVQLGE